MAIEAIGKIYEAEEKAAAVVAEAKQSAAEIIARANENKKDTLLRAETLSAEKAKEETAAILAEAEGIVNVAEAEARSEAKKLVASSAPAMEKAVSLIIEEIFGKWQ